jgi:hypothetical protein
LKGVAAHWFSWYFDAARLSATGGSGKSNGGVNRTAGVEVRFFMGNPACSKHGNRQIKLGVRGVNPQHADSGIPDKALSFRIIALTDLFSASVAKLVPSAGLAKEESQCKPSRL